MPKQKQTTYYDILGVPPTATPDEMRQRYKTLALQYHPDTIGNSPAREQLEEEFKRITEAYKTLSDPQKKAGYDKTLSRSTTALQTMKSFGSAVDRFLDNQTVAHRVDAVAQNLSLKPGSNIFTPGQPEAKKKEPKPKKERKDKSPLDSLKDRLAKGYITPEQYNQIKEALEK